MENNPATNQRSCRNCLSSLSDDAIYCPHCSQKYTTGKIPIGDLIKEFFSDQLNLDSKLFKTVWALLNPGKLTLEYFGGKHKSYVSPLRTFFVTAILLFAIVSIKTNDSVNLNDADGNFVSRAERNIAIKNLDSINQVIAGQFDNTTVSEALDSVLLGFKNVEGGGSDSTTLGKFISIGKFQNIKVSVNDIAELELDELANKYNITAPVQRIFFKQQVKTMNDGKGLFKYFVGNLSFVVLLMMPFLALFLKLLYFRRNFYYVEHLVFSFHYHAFAFLLITLLVLFGEYMGDWIAMPIVGIFIYQFVAMKRVYGQSFGKTFLKFWILNFMYIFLSSVFLVLGILISFILF